MGRLLDAPDITLIASKPAYRARSPAGKAFLKRRDPRFRRGAIVAGHVVCLDCAPRGEARGRPTPLPDEVRAACEARPPGRVGPWRRIGTWLAFGCRWHRQRWSTMGRPTHGALRS